MDAPVTSVELRRPDARRLVLRAGAPVDVLVVACDPTTGSAAYLHVALDAVPTVVMAPLGGAGVVIEVVDALSGATLARSEAAPPA
ncbi:hypothetical protein RDV89_05720 [Nocardioides zeae]|uniref:Uncharacterized protein n=1 Tax=Nocardioides imazamoxiresistens TaxID=3231893 RepID=A0ABU3PTN3_9ACTN|nr:hypothetical protein [Nocardioides zeae]MDT9592556.1 hypothetical protein [Nocardioides zeae]